MIDHRPDELAKTRFKPRAALWSGVFVGLIFLFLSRGIPWGSMGFGTSAMGRELPINETPTYFIVNSVVHIVLAIVYAFVIGRVVFRMDMAAAIAAGAIVSIVLYMLNFLIFNLGLGIHTAHEFPVAATHFFFGIVAAAAYKALSVPRVRVERPA